MFHVPMKTMERFVDGTLEEQSLRLVVDHLHSGCPQCLARLHVLADRLDARNPPVELVPGPRKAPAPGTRWRALARALRQIPRWQKEELCREHLLEVAMTEKGLKKILRLDHSPVATVEALLELAFAKRYSDPLEMLNLAKTAARFADLGADPKEHGVTELENLRARAWAELGNALRVNLRFSEAEEAFVKAWGAWQKGNRDPLLEARILDLEASLASSRRNLGKALDLLDLAQQIYEELGETHLTGRVLISRSINTFYDGRAPEAAELAREGMARIDRDRDPQLFLLAQKNLLDHLATSGQYREAIKLLFESGLRQALANDVLPFARLQWIEGKILSGLGRHRQAIRLMEQAKETFEARNEPYEVALVSLELAAVWLELREWGAVQTLTRTARMTLVDLGVPLEAGKAVILLEKACLAETASVAFFRRVVSFLRLVEWYPEMEFA